MQPFDFVPVERQLQGLEAIDHRDVVAAFPDHHHIRPKCDDLLHVDCVAVADAGHLLCLRRLVRKLDRRDHARSRAGGKQHFRGARRSTDDSLRDVRQRDLAARVIDDGDAAVGGQSGNARDGEQREERERSNHRVSMTCE